MLSAAEKERAQNEKILRVVKEQAPTTFADAIRFIISAIASGALGIQKKVVKKNSQKAFDGCDACNWAMMYYHLESRESAVQLFQALMEAGQIEDVDGKKEFKDDDKKSYFATKTLFMYDVHLEKFRADVETVIKEEIARRKGQTLQDKEKRDIKARAQSTLKKATQSLKFARGPAPVWGTPSVLEVEHDGRRLSVIRPDAEELKHTIMRMSKARADEPREGASSPSSRVRIDPPLSSSPPTRRALSPNARSRAAEDLLPPPPSRVAPTLGRSGSPLVEPPSPTQAPAAATATATASAAPTEPSAEAAKAKDEAKHRARPVTTALTRKEQAAAAERKPTILQVTPQMTSQAHIKDVLSDAQELLKMHRAGLTGNMTDGEWKGFALSSVEMLERLMGTVVALHMHKRKQEDDIRTLKGLIHKRDPAAAIPSLSSVSSPSRRTMAPAPKKSTRDTTLLHNMRVEVAPNPAPSTTETDAPPRRASQHLPPEEKVAKPVVAKSDAVKTAPEPTQEKPKSEAPAAAGAGTWVSPGAPKSERKPEPTAPKAAATEEKEKKPAAQDNNKVRGTMDKVVEPYPENVAKRRKEIVTKLGYDLFEALKNPTYDTTKLETYLTGHEFQACFLMTPADFAALPRHTQIQAKRNIGL